MALDGFENDHRATMNHGHHEKIWVPWETNRKWCRIHPTPALGDYFWYLKISIANKPHTFWRRPFDRPIRPDWGESFAPCQNKFFDCRAATKMRICRLENQKFQIMEPVAWDHIFFSFRDVGSWHFQKMIFEKKCCDLIGKNFWNPSISTSKNRSECRKRTKHMTAVRCRITHADANTLRCTTLRTIVGHDIILWYCCAMVRLLNYTSPKSSHNSICYCSSPNVVHDVRHSTRWRKEGVRDTHPFNSTHPRTQNHNGI